MIPLLELEVLLLPLGNAADHLPDAPDEWPELLVVDVRRVCQHLEAEGQHGIPRVDGGGVVELDVHGPQSPPDWVLVHDVVVDEGEVVDDLDAGT